MANKSKVMYFLMFSAVAVAAGFGFFDSTPQNIGPNGSPASVTKSADLHYKRGIINFKALHFKEAIREWESALAITNGKDSQEYKKIEAEIAIARKRLNP